MWHQNTTMRNLWRITMLKSRESLQFVLNKVLRCLYLCSQQLFYTIQFNNLHDLKNNISNDFYRYYSPVHRRLTWEIFGQLFKKRSTSRSYFWNKTVWVIFGATKIENVLLFYFKSTILGLTSFKKGWTKISVGWPFSFCEPGYNDFHHVS